MPITKREKRSLQLAAMGGKKPPRKGSKAHGAKLKAERALAFARKVDIADAKVDAFIRHFDYAVRCYAEGRFDSAYDWAKDAIKAGASASDYREFLEREGQGD